MQKVINVIEDNIANENFNVKNIGRYTLYESTYII